MSDFDDKLKDHLLKYHLRDLEHDAEIVKLTGQNESLFDDIDRLRAEIKQLQQDLVIGIRQRQNKAEDFLTREGYRACDIPACNCGSWHK